MKKLYFFIIMGLSLLFGYFYLLNPKITYDLKLPKSVDKVVFINPSKIRNDFIIDLIKSPLNWTIPSFKDKEDNAFDYTKLGIKQAKIAGVFSISKLQNTYFFKAEIEDELTILENLEKLKFSKQENYWFLESKNTYALFKDKYFYFIQTLNIELALEKITAEEEMEILDVNDHNNPKKHHLSFIIPQQNVNIHFNTNILKRKITWDSEFKYKYKFQNTPLISDQNISKISVGFPMDKSFFKASKFQKISNISLDSLYNYKPENLTIAIKDIQIIKDSVLETRYDEDFNSIEETVIHETKKLNFRADLKSENPAKIYHYLKQEELIDSLENQEIFIPFPLEKTNIKYQSNKLTLSSDSIHYKVEPKSNLILDLSLKMMDLTKIDYLKSWDFLQKLKQLNMQAIQDSNNIIKLKGDLTFKQIEY